jgi:transcriptional regulator with XRE-family HTH domain
MGIGDKLKSARIAAGLSQLDVQEIIGMNNKTLSNYECEVSRPHAEEIAVLCKLYKISADEIIDVPLSDREAKEFYKRYLNASRKDQALVELALGYRPLHTDDQQEGRE